MSSSFRDGADILKMNRVLLRSDEAHLGYPLLVRYTETVFLAPQFANEFLRIPHYFWTPTKKAGRYTIIKDANQNSSRLSLSGNRATFLTAYHLYIFSVSYHKPNP